MAQRRAQATADENQNVAHLPACHFAKWTGNAFVPQAAIACKERGSKRKGRQPCAAALELVDVIPGRCEAST